MNEQRAVEMMGYGKRGKPTAGFPRFPQPLEIAARFPHSHRPDDAVEKWKSRCRIPTFPRPCFSLTIHSKQNRKEAWRPVASLPPPGSLLDEKMLS